MSTVLYDTPGPKARRNTLIASVLIGLALLAVVVVALLKLNEQDQLSELKWGPLVNPGNPIFPLVWASIGEAAVNTLVAAGWALVFSLIVGTVLAMSRVTAARWYRWLVVGLMELLRGLPVVIMIFFASRVLPNYGLGLDNVWYLVIGLTLYNSVIIAEIIRAGIASLPSGQLEAGLSIGLTRWQALRLIQLPQAFRAMLPALISQLVVVLKDTSLGFIVLYEELVRRANILVQDPQMQNPLQMFLIIAALFVLTNWLLSKLAEWVERRLSSRTAAKADPAAIPGTYASATGGAAI
ncbi:amino acid ABC transporter permease [Pseudonocardiaceae bacterium YIM PH 21723]|nr:amino acid ABC transporter permease [Pseudonocardiaceae bacterium YIM PH 21723]